jgi:hypothetical protein
MKLSSMNQNFQWLMLQNWGIEEEKKLSRIFLDMIGIFQYWPKHFEFTIRRGKFCFIMLCGTAVTNLWTIIFLFVYQKLTETKIELAEKKYVLSLNVSHYFSESFKL